MRNLSFFAIVVASLSFYAMTTASENSELTSTLLSYFEANGKANVFISFEQEEFTKLFDSSKDLTRSQRITAAKDALTYEATKAQKNVISYLDSLNLQSSNVLSYSSLWITNQLYVRNISQEVVTGLLAACKEIKNIRLEKIFPFQQLEQIKIRDNDGVLAEWGVDKIQAEAAHALLKNLTNDNIPEIRVAVLGTGARVSHERIASSYLGDYGWYDPYNSTEPMPVDLVGVGSHEVGVISGSGGIGVFPSAKWMACRSCEVTGCSEFSILKCAEFTSCPTLTDGTYSNCSLAAHVVHADWGSRGGGTFFDKALELWEHFGIIPVFPVGGSGPGCSTVGYPAESGKVISAGGITPEDKWFERSSAGPGLGGIIKPDLVGPATNVMSAYNLDDETLMGLSGTTVASAHVAGLVALLKGYDQGLTREDVVEALAAGAERDALEMVGEDENCGGIPVTDFPNNVFGHGRIDALKALRYLVDRG